MQQDTKKITKWEEEKIQKITDDWIKEKATLNFEKINQKDNIDKNTAEAIKKLINYLKCDNPYSLKITDSNLFKKAFNFCRFFVHNRELSKMKAKIAVKAIVELEEGKEFRKVKTRVNWACEYARYSDSKPILQSVDGNKMIYLPGKLESCLSIAENRLPNCTRYFKFQNYCDPDNVASYNPYIAEEFEKPYKKWQAQAKEQNAGKDAVEMVKME